MVITTFFYYKSITTLVQTLILYSRTKSSDIQAVCVYAYQLLPVKRGGGVDGRSEHAMIVLHCGAIGFEHTAFYIR